MRAVAVNDGLWILGFSTLAATVVTFGFKTTHDADSVLTVFMSTQRITWYYWEQNRYANVVPWIVSSIRDPAFNFHAQLILRNISALLSFAFALVLVGERTNFAAKFFAALVIWQVCAGKLILFSVAIAQPVSCALFLAGLLLLRRNNRTQLQSFIMLFLSFLLFTASFMVNISLAAVVVPFAVGCWLFARNSVSPFARNAPNLVLLGSILLSYAHATLTPPRTPTALSFDWQGANNALVVMINTVNMTKLSILSASILLLGWLAHWLKYRKFEPFAVQLPVLHFLSIGAVLACTLIFANLSWVRDNGNAERYYSVGTLILLTLASVWLIDFLANAIGSLQNYLAPFLGLLAFALISYGAGYPTADRTFASNVHGQELAINGELTQMLLALPTQGPLLVVGDYWFAPPLLY